MSVDTGGSDAQTVAGGETSGITELPSGRVASSNGITPELIEEGFLKAQERLGNSGGATLGGKPADETNLLKSAGIEISKAPLVQETADAAIGSDSKVAEQSSIDSDQDLESMLETERQQKTQETQEAWVNLINAMKESATPFFAASVSKEMLFLIKPTRDPSSPDSEVYVVITKDGPKMIQATKEARRMINNLYLNPTEDPTINKLETLEMTPLLISGASDPISPVIKESQEMAARIGEKRKEIEALKTSRNLAEKLKGSLSPQQATPISS